MIEAGEDRRRRELRTLAVAMTFVQHKPDDLESKGLPSPRVESDAASGHDGPGDDEFEDDWMDEIDVAASSPADD